MGTLKRESDQTGPRSSCALFMLAILICLNITACVSTPRAMQVPDDPASRLGSAASVGAERLVRLLQQRSARDVRVTFQEYGGLITTQSDGMPPDELLDAPQLTVHRNLDVLPSGEDTVGGNEINISVSAPAGHGLISTVDITFTFDQYSSLSTGNLTLDKVRHAFDAELLNMTLSSIGVDLHLDPEAFAGTSEYVYFDFERGQFVARNYPTRTIQRRRRTLN